ncbi:MAG: hypothetical protein K940chlam1_01338, partial [Candidatus Anoxychlamydiales bacterium]|nr:hypothetical protein [Candidatus Anoxychlamydiales bacterium]
MTVSSIYQFREGVQLTLDKKKELSSFAIGKETILNEGRLHGDYAGISGSRIDQKISSLKQIVKTSKHDLKSQETKIHKIGTEILKDLKDLKPTSDIREISSDVSSKIYANKITQIEKNSPKYRYLSKVFVAILVVAMISAMIATGSILTIFHIIPVAIGISGISLAVSTGLISFGAATGLIYAGAKVYSHVKKDSKIAQLMKAIDLSIRNLYLFSNLNDSAGTLSYLIPLLLLVSFFPHTAAIAIAAKCAAYPAGILYGLSGLQQLYESSIDLKNSWKNKNYLNKNWINFAVSFVAIAMGVIFILGLQVSPIGIYTNLILNFLPFLVIGITIYAVRKQLNQIKAVSTDVASDKLQYLKNTLSLDAEELSDLSKKVSTFNVTDIKKWIINNTSVLDRLNKKKIRDKNDWVAILNELNEENEIKEKRLEDIRKMILKK